MHFKRTEQTKYGLFHEDDDYDNNDGDVGDDDYDMSGVTATTLMYNNCSIILHVT